MLPLKFFKFGREKNHELPISDTPVTQLSKILQQTSFVEPKYAQLDDHPRLRKISETIPADIDESANQEPPPMGFTSWLESNDFPNSTIPSSKPLITRDYSNSYSSGYCSSSNTQSAPPTCNIERLQTSCPSVEKCSPPNCISLITEPSCLKTAAGYSPVHTLRRTQSCSTRGWLAKRHRKQPWPRISGITRHTTPGSLSPSNMTDTNSCPPALHTERNENSTAPVLRRYSLPTVGETCASGGSSPLAVKLFNRFTLSPINTSDERVCEQESMNLSSLRPLAKKLRMDSSFIDSPTKPELDSTMPLGDLSTCDSDVVPEKLQTAAESSIRPKPLFDMFRHQSTPMVPTRSMSLNYPTIPSPMQLASAWTRRSRARGASVPAQPVPDKLTRCMSALDNHNLRFEDRRPRALPVVDRTASGLHCVSTDTVADLVSQSSSKRNVRHVIIDCRFPYEYEGGHIQGAINIFTHSELVQEIFNRVPAQRPPGASGPPRLLGEGLSRRLAMTLKEPLSAPCEPISDESSLDDQDALGHTSFGDASDMEQASEQSMSESVHHSRTDDSPSSRSEPDLSVASQGSGPTGSQEPAFVVIFHCEFSSQRAPDLATFLRSIDRVSNYHRYPFLYFPEIYIMKGGYSAFYRKHAHLCCPQNYVKMFHRDYRTQLRLYKRLTKRVSSACLACIRPEHQLLVPTIESSSSANLEVMNSFGQVFVPSSHPAMIAAEVVNAALDPMGTSASTQARLAMIDSMMRGGSKDKADPWIGIDDDDDKENRATHSDKSQPALPPSSPVHSDAFQSKKCSSQQNSFSRDPVASPADDRSSPGSSNPDNQTALSDNSLSLAEVVVRVGRRVIAATLSSADPSAAHLLHKFTQPNDIKDPGLLRRRNTINGLEHLTNRPVLSRPSKRVPLAPPISFALGSDEPSTPAMSGLRRVQTLQFTPVQGCSSGKGPGWDHTETPISGRVPTVSTVRLSLSNPPSHGPVL